MVRYREAVGLRGGGDPVYSYTSSISHDKAIARYAVFITILHTLHLAKRNLIPSTAACRAVRVLLEALDNPHALLRDGYEDVFEALESHLEEKIGGPAGYIWLGRSRNDHVSAALRLYVVEGLLETARALLEARRNLLGLMEAYGEVVVPLHTHQQPSQMAPARCLFACWEEALASSTRILLEATGLAARCPLGAGAGAGTMAPLDRRELALLCGFRETIWSTVYAAGSRLDVSWAAAAAAMALVEMSRVAADIIWLSTPYTGILRLPESHVSTSSIMPHKRNPVTLEVLRARGSRAAGLLAALASVQAGLPYGYNLDLQEANPLIYQLIGDARESAAILADLLGRLEVDAARAEKLIPRYAASAEAAEELAMRTGRPLRETYREVARRLAGGESLDGLAEKLGYSSPVDLALSRRVDCSASIGEILARLRADEERVEALGRQLGSSWEDVLAQARKLIASC